MLYQRTVGGLRARRLCIRDYVRPTPGMRVLDIGCGPGYAMRSFPEPEYYGFDIEPQYIDYAQRRFSTHGRFFCRYFDEEQLGWLPPVDVVLMLGVLHHLDDAIALRLLDLAKRAMKPSGCLVTLDGCYRPRQSRIEKYFLDRDRGRFIREQDQYVQLANRVFPRVDGNLRQDLFFIPQPTLILQCRP